VLKETRPEGSESRRPKGKVGEGGRSNGRENVSRARRQQALRAQRRTCRGELQGGVLAEFAEWGRWEFGKGNVGESAVRGDMPSRTWEGKRKESRLQARKGKGLRRKNRYPKKKRRKREPTQHQRERRGVFPKGGRKDERGGVIGKKRGGRLKG